MAAIDTAHYVVTAAVAATWTCGATTSHGIPAWTTAYYSTLQSRVDPAVTTPNHGTLVLAMSSHGGPARAMPHRRPMLSHGISVPPLQSQGTPSPTMLN